MIFQMKLVLVYSSAAVTGKRNRASKPRRDGGVGRRMDAGQIQASSVRDRRMDEEVKNDLKLSRQT